jgi:hypothetical protein
MSVGYQHASYAESFASVGRPCPLERSGGWVVERPIGNTAWVDGVGCYPFLVCDDWSALSKDLDDYADEWVSVSLVTDPFGVFSFRDLKSDFGEVCRAFKEHYVVDLGRPLREIVCRHHQRNARKGLRTVEVSRVEKPAQCLQEWIALYDVLIARHAIRGVAAFSGEAFEKQFAVPGLIVFRAEQDGEAVGFVLWYAQGEVAYYHLGAYSQRGYRDFASFALFWQSLEYFSESGFRQLGLGAGAGLQNTDSDGLSRFKSGWATARRTVYFCGRIFRPDLYRRLVGRSHSDPTEFFPAYRAGQG